MSFSDQALVRKSLCLLTRFSQRQDQAHCDLWGVLGEQIQHRLHVAVIGTNHDLITVPLDGVAVDLQGQIFIGLFFLNHPDRGQLIFAGWLILDKQGQLGRFEDMETVDNLNACIPGL
ncbi:hypothetical protein [Rhodoferax sp.]|uniref:hypothetical protein n=1 Tax=Rhodoferax sp. TaxID=50421 RepID=UPI002743BF58|nr:hypothetical protein [Rhodoferax sp.]